MKRAGQFLTLVRRNKITKEFFLIAKITSASLVFTTMCAVVAFYIFTDPRINHTSSKDVKGTSHHVSLNAPLIPTIAQSEMKASAPTPTPQKQTPPPGQKAQATQIDEVTWTVEVDKDERVGTHNEIFNALNAYRAKKGKATLVWDDSLASFAQSRADLFAGHGGTDKHAGFNSFLNDGGFTKLGFNSLGENSSFGYQVTGEKLIEEVYASDAPHNDNQLADKWTHVGIGVNGVATDIVFGGNKQ